MAFNIKDIIFKLFGDNDKRRDTYKDINGKGILQRYNEMLAEDFDDEMVPLINNLLDNTLVPDTVLEKFIAYLEDMLGDGVRISDTIASRRKVLRYLMRIYAIKGTKKGYEVLFKMMGFDTITFTEYYGTSGFDSDITFDDVDRRFDGRCASCSGYSIAITGTITLTPAIIQYIFNVIKFNQPINADLLDVTYNGTSINADIISIFVDANGDLIYDNQYALGTIFTVDANGDLFVNGVYAERYSINDDGDLIFT